MEVLIGYIFAHIVSVILIIVLICLNNTRAYSGLIIVIFKIAVRVLIFISTLRLPHIALLLRQETLVGYDIIIDAVFIIIVIGALLIFVLFC